MRLLDAHPGEALHTCVARSLRDVLARGILPEGTRLPGHRRLAAHLGVSRNTLVDALTQLQTEGFLRVMGRSGTLVSLPPIDLSGDYPRESLPLSDWATRVLRERPAGESGDFHVDFRLGQDVPELYPEVAWTQALARRAGEAGRSQRHSDPLGPLETRRALSAYLNAERGARVTPDMVMLTAGTQAALDALARVFLQRGRSVAIEDPTYAGARAALAATGAEIHPVAVDAEGLHPGHLPGAATLVYVTPGCQYPTTATLPASRRQELIGWARRVHALILEDDYAADLHHTDRVPAVLQGLAPERTLLLGTFSKVLAPATRSGFLVAPPEVVSVLAATRTLTDRGPGTLDALALGDVLASGAYARHLRRVRPLIRERHEALLCALAEFLPGWPVRAARAGLHIYLPLPAGLQELDVTQRATGWGVGLTRQGPLTGGSHQPAVLLGFAHLAPDALRDGVQRLACALDGLPGVAAPRRGASPPARV
ncbi:PLP-dependent aminotransferase family protein [Deinococcus sp. KSM4-11]|uniref:aminotransferase-like domain-containing protein n=1 Tax=Deinococcus sp. KSM4-11 TaxID=2568654 RepID=UPI0010A55B7F|nr:PLP-dependent aminotransferase family protein [Deinococcus sp. KSM4-11]THF88515.1 PLP-dependent aminotransferase family protein [Deinococcus sp. KSM4-11]